MTSKTKNSTFDNPEDKLDEHCTVFVSFDSQIEEFLNCPFTACGCYDSRHVCSHAHWDVYYSYDVHKVTLVIVRNLITQGLRILFH